MAKITAVTANDDHTLLIELSNDHKVFYDMRSRLEAVRFAGLMDINRFKAVKVEYENTLVWDNLCEISIDEIFNMLER